MNRRRAILLILIFAALVVAILLFTPPAQPLVRVGMHKSEAQAAFAPYARPGSRGTLLIKDVSDNNGKGFYALSTDYFVGRYQRGVEWDSEDRVNKVWRRWRWRWVKDL